ncbi:hypothetical protein [Actinoplanes sp. NPDC051411]|uniref:hypothetical protein n=1 Tax=Actinoplanes sp. NPDC051411 TaxID=3155522 RepID=UPI0034318AB8
MVIKVVQLYITPAALDLIAAHHAEEGDAYNTAASYILRHHRGDWGEVDARDSRSNDAAVQSGDRILSAYTQPCTNRSTCPHGEHELWVITDPGHRVTTLLRPQDY